MLKDEKKKKHELKNREKKPSKAGRKNKANLKDLLNPN
jgi:hypothetical protein